MFVEADISIDEGVGLKTGVLREVGEGVCVVATSQMVFRRLLRRAEAEAQLPASKVTAILAQCFNFEADGRREGFAIKVSELQFEGKVGFIGVQAVVKEKRADVKLPFGLSVSQVAADPVGASTDTIGSIIGGRGIDDDSGEELGTNRLDDEFSSESEDSDGDHIMKAKQGVAEVACQCSHLTSSGSKPL